MPTTVLNYMKKWGIYSVNIEEKLLALNIFENNQYFDLYIDLINKNKNTKKEKFKTAAHHILPKSYAKKLGISVDNSKNNLVNLLHKDHALAHYYLAFCTSDPYFKYSAANSINHIAGFSKKMGQLDIENFIKNLDRYQELMEVHAQENSKKYRGKLAGDKNPAKRPDVRLKISQALKGRESSTKGMKIHDEAWRKQMAKNRMGKIPVTNSDKIQKWINPEELAEYIEKGWHYGTNQKGKIVSEESKIKNSIAHKGRIRITDGKNNKDIFPEKLPEWEKKGWRRGLTKQSYVGGMKGKHLTTEQKEHLRALNKGRKGTFTGCHHTKETKEKISLKNKNRRHTDEFKQKLSEARKGKIAVHKPSENKTKYIIKEDLGGFLMQGYVKGGAKRNNNIKDETKC